MVSHCALIISLYALKYFIECLVKIAGFATISNRVDFSQHCNKELMAPKMTMPK